MWEGITKKRGQEPHDWKVPGKGRGQMRRTGDKLHDSLLPEGFRPRTALT